MREIVNRPARSLNDLAQEILEINAANGWNITTPADWHQTEADALDGLEIGEPHQVGGAGDEDCMGGPVRARRRVFVTTKRNSVHIGFGRTDEEAVDDAKRKVLDDPVAAYKIPAILALVTSEVSEALEAFRTRDRDNFEEELADVVIRVLDLAGGLGIDLDKALQDKLLKNRQRSYRHGNKVV